MTFTKDGIVRRAKASNKEAFETSDRMVRVRENSAEFGHSATAGALVRQALRKQIKGVADRYMTGRLTRTLREVAGQDTVSLRGERQVQKGNISGLVGFDFNDGAPLGALFFAPYQVTASPDKVTLAIPVLDPRDDLKAPVGATHFTLEVGVALVDFAAETAATVAVTGVPAAASLKGAPLMDLKLEALLPVGVPFALVVALGVNFYQELNGQLYALKVGAMNPLRVVYAGRSFN